MSATLDDNRRSGQLVSVVIPCYNQARFLGEAIESVLMQTYPDVEIVVVDDGSTDNTSEVAAGYPGVRCVRQENQGLSAARNTGLRHSLGRYLVFLDADDLLLLDALAVGYRTLQGNPACAFVSGQHRLVYDDGSPPSVVTYVVERDHYLALLGWNYIGMHATVMYRRWVFDAVGEFDVSLPACEDYDLYLRIAQRYPVCCHDAVVADYRQHGANMSSNATLMLTTSLAVLRRHAASVELDERSRAAYKAGIRFWRECYGRPLARQILDHARSGEVVAAAQESVMLLRHYPRAFALGGRQALRRVGRRLPIVVPSASSRHSEHRSPSEESASAQQPVRRRERAHREQAAPVRQIPRQARDDDRSGGERPLVSCITIFLNAEQFIEEAIESVLAQSYDNWELLLVDDGSTDRSTPIAREYVERYPSKVRYLEHEGHENRGMSAARNLGAAHARGDLIAFLDADDVWLPNKLDEQVAILNDHPEAAMVYGRTRYWYSWSGKPEDAGRDCESDPGFEVAGLVEPPLPLIRYLQDEEHYPCTCSFAIRREVVERVGGFDERFRDLYEDMVFHAKVFVEAPVFVADACWDLYRLHAQSSWVRAKQAGRWHPNNPNPARRAYLEWLEAYLLAKNIQHEELWRLLRRELRPYRHRSLYRISGSIGRLEDTARVVARRVLPARVRRRLRSARRRLRWPPVGRVSFGSLRRVTPINDYFGFEVGQPIDRYYIENFLACHTDDIKGRALEIADNSYTVQFGGERVNQSDVLHMSEGVPGVTIVGDLATGENVPSDAFDCIICTQTLHLIFDVPAVIRTLHRALRPGGVLLVTFPGISQIYDDEWSSNWYWAFTVHSARRLFGAAFPESHLTIEPHGNVLAAISLLHGLTSDELRQSELDYHDPLYQVLITVRATKSGATS